MIRAHVVFKGRVQGVFFRAHTKDRADELGVKGWVANLENGDVEAVFEGEDEKVRDAIEYCSKGQPHANVTEAVVNFEECRNEFKDFEIRRKW